MWIGSVQHIVRTQRYTLGARIDERCLDLIEETYIAYTTQNEYKLRHIDKAIGTLGVLRILLQTAWQGKVISIGLYTKINIDLEEIGKMLGGWKKGLIAKSNQNKNTPT